jgi:hypothetical protein
MAELAYVWQLLEDGTLGVYGTVKSVTLSAG